jgi:hypothetical protein
VDSRFLDLLSMGSAHSAIIESSVPVPFPRSQATEPVVHTAECQGLPKRSACRKECTPTGSGTRVPASLGKSDLDPGIISKQLRDTSVSVRASYLDQFHLEARCCPYATL